GKMGDRQNRQPRLACRRAEQLLDLQRIAFGPYREAGRRHQIVDRRRKFKAFLRGEETVDVEKPDLVERRLLNRMDQVAEVDVAARAPGAVENTGQENVLAAPQRIAFDSDKRQ